MEKHLGGKWAYPCIIAAYLAAVFYGVLHLFFVQDDFWFLKNAISHREFDTSFIKGFLPEFVRPLPTYWFFRLNHWLWGLNPFGYHLSQLTIHVTTAIAVYFIITMLTKDRPIAFLGAIMYGASRIHLETLAWVSGSIENLVMLFFALSLLCYLKFFDSRQRIYSFLCCAFLVGALLSKENAVVIPFVMLAHRVSVRMESTRAEKAHFLSLFLILAAYFVLRVTLVEGVHSGFLFRLSRPIKLFAYGVQALFPAAGFGNGRPAQYILLFGLWAVLLLSNRWGSASINHLSVISLAAATMILPLLLFAFTRIPKNLSPYYSTMSLVGFSILTAYAASVLKQRWFHASKNKYLQVVKPLLFMIVIAYSVFAASAVDKVLKTRANTPLAMERFSRSAFNQLDFLISGNDFLLSNAEKVIVFKDIRSKMYWAIGFGQMIDVMFAQKGVAYYFLDSKEVKGNLSANSSLLSRENTVVLKQINDLRFVNPKPPIYRFGVPVDLGRSGNCLEYEMGGWSDPEDGFSWTDGKSASLVIPLQATHSDLVFKALVTPFLIPGRIDSQRVSILINGERIAEWKVGRKTGLCQTLWARITPGGKFQEETAIIPGPLLKDSPVKVTFELPDAARPAEFGVSGDKRTLGLAIKSIVITPFEREQESGG